MIIQYLHSMSLLYTTDRWECVGVFNEFNGKSEEIKGRKPHNRNEMERQKCNQLREDKSRSRPNEVKRSNSKNWCNKNQCVEYHKQYPIGKTRKHTNFLKGAVTLSYYFSHMQMN